jgi:hypothetical protein
MAILRRGNARMSAERSAVGVLGLTLLAFLLVEE